MPDTAVARPLLTHPVRVTLRDGTPVWIRPVRTDDYAAIHTFLAGLSQDSLYYRGCGYPNIDFLTGWSLDIDFHDRYGVLVADGLWGPVLGHAAYVRETGSRVEAAFEVADSLQGLGMGTLLLAHLAAVAAYNGFQQLEAAVMPANHLMLETLRDSGFEITADRNDGLRYVVLSTELTDTVRAAFAARGQAQALALLTG
ncbi:MAG: GNAT family N-acetyltransferase [Solirubrobacterales bacterium]|nr:GNAT family N-acetyltransferase [Solirubrobacterales bacterium]